MKLEHYLIMWGTGFGIIVIACTPLLLSAVVAYIPGQKPEKKLKFIVTCAIYASGISYLISLPLVPFQTWAIYLGPHLAEDGYIWADNLFRNIAEYSELVEAFIIYPTALLTPIYFRKKLLNKFAESEH
ncbi:MAG: hypothetical protein OQL19_15100 [Gammaproteobacteria bacterium]|nr:hypothetical protein [Gammaproteobacteria bacterium]